MLINKQNLGILFTGYKASFQSAFVGTEPDFDQFTLTVPSTNSVEQYGWFGNSTMFREWAGDRVIQNLSVSDYSIKNKSFENTVGVKATMIKDDSYGLMSPLMAQLGQDAKNHPATLLYSLLQNGFTQACYDGQFYFDTDHPVLDVTGATTSVSNFGGGSGNPWFLFDTSRVMKPLILQKREDYKFVSLTKDDDENVFMRDEFIYGVSARLNVGYGLWQLAYASKQTLDATGFNAAYAAMQGFKGDKGKPLGVRPTLLVCGPSSRAAALDTIKAERDALGATNTNLNAVNVLVTPWLP